MDKRTSQAKLLPDIRDRYRENKANYNLNQNKTAFFSCSCLSHSRSEKEKVAEGRFTAFKLVAKLDKEYLYLSSSFSLWFFIFFLANWIFVTVILALHAHFVSCGFSGVGAKSLIFILILFQLLQLSHFVHISRERGKNQALPISHIILSFFN